MFSMPLNAGKAKAIPQHSPSFTFFILTVVAAVDDVGGIRSELEKLGMGLSQGLTCF